MNDTARIKAIREMEPYQVLYLWRFEPAGSPWIVGEVGYALAQRYERMRKELSDGEFVALSKQVGWER